MKIGLLDCDHLAPALQTEFEDYAEAFERLLQPYTPDWEFVSYKSIDGELPDSPNECNAYIITGSKYSAYDDSCWIDALKTFICELNRRNQEKLVGICFGHQVIAAALGGKVNKAENGWGLGVKHFELSPDSSAAQHAWMEPRRSEYSLLMSHQDQVVTLPENAVLLGSSSYCPIAAFTLGDHILTFQGHPEFSIQYLTGLINSRRERLDEKVVEKALTSMAQPVNGIEVSQWLVNFLRAK